MMLFVLMLLVNVVYGVDYRKPALLSSSAYCNPDEILNWSCRPCKGISDIRVDSFYEIGADVELYTAYDYEVNWVVFRGSDSIEDWLMNVDIELEPANWECEFSIHGGFKRVWEESYTDIQYVLSKVNRSRPIFFAGHSLGGVLATLTAYNLSYIDSPIYTFGMPRIGDNAFTDCFSSYELYRFVNERDIFAHLPPLFMDYRHPPREYWWIEDELNDCSPIDGEDMACSDSFPGGISIDDHRFFSNIEFKCVGEIGI